MNNLINNFHFLRPLWLLCLPISAGLWIWIRHCTRPGHELQDQIAPHLLRHLISEPKQASRLTPLNLLLPIWILSLIAIAGPAWRKRPSPFADDQAQLMIVIKVTESMMTDDLPPSRLEQTRGKLSELIAARSGAGTGLIAYSGSAHLVMPVTDDGDVINHMLQALDPSVMPDEGDTLRTAIDMASEQLANSTAGGSILVVADGISGNSITEIAKLPATTAPIQFFVPLRTEQAVSASGIAAAADAISAPLQTITADNDDVNSLIARADRAIVAAIDGDATAWRDEGYLLLPILAVGCLFWSRHGWSIGE